MPNGKSCCRNLASKAAGNNRIANSKQMADHNRMIAENKGPMGLLFVHKRNRL